MKSTWKDLTIEDVLYIRNISELQMASEDEKNLKVAAYLGNITYDEIMSIPLSKLKKYMDNTKFLFTSPVPSKVKRYYTINGRSYKLLKNEMELLTSQYIDFQYVYADGFEKRPAELLSIMMVPAGHEYNDGYDKDQVVKDMYSLPIEEGLGICDFFTNRFTRSIWLGMILLRVKIWWMKITARKKDREMWKAIEIQMRLIVEELGDTFGLHV